MKKILVIANFANTYSGSFIASLESFHKLYNTKIEMIYVFPKSSNPDYQKWMSEFSKNKKVIFIDFSESEFEKAINDTRPDICWCHFLSVAPVTSLSFKHESTLFYFHAHGQLYFTNFQLLKLNIKKRRKPSNLHVICASKPLIKFFRPFIKHKNIHVVRNAVDFSRFNENIASSKNGVAMFGYDWKIKGVDIACEAINYLLEQYNLNVKLDIYCSKNIEDSRGISAKFPNCDINVIYSSGNPTKVYKEHQIFISPSRKEAFCYSIVESIYCGTPVIFSDIPEQRHNDEFSFKFKTQNPKSLAKEMHKLFRNYDALTEGIGSTKFKENLVKKYSLDEWSKDVYNWLLSNGK